jgi:hypothetical protein
MKKHYTIKTNDFENSQQQFIDKSDYYIILLNLFRYH